MQGKMRGLLASSALALMAQLGFVNVALASGLPPQVDPVGMVTFQQNTVGTITLNMFDPEGDLLVVDWSGVLAIDPAATLGSGSVQAFMVPPASGPLDMRSFTVNVNDGTNMVPVTVEFTIGGWTPGPGGPGGGLPPVVTPPTFTMPIGGMVNENTGFTLSPIGVTPGGNNSGPITYFWTQIGGPPAIIQTPDHATAFIIAPDVASGTIAPMIFQLTVTQGGQSMSGLVTMQVVGAVENAAPTVTFSSAQESFLAGETVEVQARFSEEVNGFTAEDLITDAEVISITGSGMDYQIRLRPTGARLSLSLRAESVEDVHGIRNPASEAFSIEGEAVVNVEEEAQAAAQQGVQTRNRALLAVQPNLTSFFGTQGGHGNARMLGDAGNVDFSYRSKKGWWFNLQGEWTKLEESDVDYVNLAFGADVYRDKNVIIGMMGQIDRSDSSANSDIGTFESRGWLVGPYWVSRMEEQPVVFSSSYLWGRSENEVVLPGVSKGEFSGLRSLMTASIEGRFDMAKHGTLIPELQFARLEDRLDTYQDDNGAWISGQEILQNEAKFGLGVEFPVAVNAGGLLVRGGVNGTYAMLKVDDVSSTSTWRGGVETGFTYVMPKAGQLALDLHYDGLGLEGYKSFGGNINFSMDF